MSSYSRNKYRCLLKPNVNVFHLDSNIPNQNQKPQPRIYPYGYPYGYSGYPYGYPAYGYPGGYPGYHMYPYVEKKYNLKENPKDKAEDNPKMVFVS